MFVESGYLQHNGYHRRMQNAEIAHTTSDKCSYMEPWLYFYANKYLYYVLWFTYCCLISSNTVTCSIENFKNRLSCLHNTMIFLAFWFVCKTKHCLQYVFVMTVQSLLSFMRNNVFTHSFGNLSCSVLLGNMQFATTDMSIKI